jgi:hypothetical protein
LSFNSYSECKWSSIQKTGETFVYDKDCHLEVGKLVTLAPLKDQEIFLLKDKNIKTEQIITLKDLEIKKLNEKSDLWETNSKDLNDKIQKIEKYNKVENWLYFGAGSLSVALAVYLASKLTK